MLNGLIRMAGAAIGLCLGMRWHWFQQPRPFPRHLAGLLHSGGRRRYLDPEAVADLCGIAPGMTVLEVGCGTGVMTTVLAKRLDPAGKILALEIQAPLLAQARARLTAAGLADRVEFHQADAPGAAIGPHTSDLIVLGSVLGELPDIHDCLTHLFEIARPASRVVVFEETLNPAYVPAGMARMHLHAAGFRQGGLVRKLTHYIAVYYKDSVEFDPGLQAGRHE